MESNQLPPGYELGHLPDSKDPDYIAGYQAGEKNAAFGKLSDIDPLPEGWKFPPKGSSRQWGKGHMQALWDKGVSDVNPATLLLASSETA